MVNDSRMQSVRMARRDATGRTAPPPAPSSSRAHPWAMWHATPYARDTPAAEVELEQVLYTAVRRGARF
jgi:hypothetical protein